MTMMKSRDLALPSRANHSQRQQKPAGAVSPPATPHSVREGETARVAVRCGIDEICAWVCGARASVRARC